MKRKPSVKRKADWPEIIPEKPKLWCTNHVISWKFLIKYYKYFFDYLIFIMNQL